jgi:chaperonin cofactor prefoldin
MFFTDKHKKYIAQLNDKIEFYNVEIKNLKTRLDIQTTRIDALMKAYPYGANKDGSPRQKPGRKAKVKA